jgi:glycosyltransferase involved in cell wall biosynthesis
MRVDTFFDWSFVGAAEIATLSEQALSREGLRTFQSTITLVLPGGIAQPFYDEGWHFVEPKRAADSAASAVETAGEAGHALLFVLGGFVPSLEVVGALLASLDRDPMFGFAIPRVSAMGGSGIERLPNAVGDGDLAFLPRRAICDLPDMYIVPELVAPCVLVHNRVLANVAMSRGEFRSVAGALLHYLGKSRRIGFRGVVANRVVVACGPKAARADSPDPADFWKLLELLPDFNRTRLMFDELSSNTHEAFLARAHSPQPHLRKSMLLDATAMGAAFNGTSESTLGLAGGLQSLRSDWKIILAVHDDAREFHRLNRRFPDWEIVSGKTSCQATVALKFSQPWAFESMRDLHRQALLNFFLVLDTIAWDILLGSLETLDEIWRFSAHYSDGLFYISDFTGNRFRTRFPIGPGVAERTLHLSFHPRDYVRRDAFVKSDGKPGYWLVIGNAYDHKDLVRTVDMLAGCFPFQRIRVVGLQSSAHFNVEFIASGSVSELEMDRLYANALAVIFPSFYEGFGFPVIRGLSYGKAVVARKSLLLDELAANYRGDGRLFGFGTHRELVEIVASLLDGEPSESRPLGLAIASNSEPLDWTATAANMLNFFESCLADPGQGRWLARERAFRQMAAYRF